MLSVLALNKQFLDLVMNISLLVLIILRVQELGSCQGALR